MKNIEQIDEYGNTPLLAATSSGQESIALFLIDRGANIEAVDILGLMLVHHAIGQNLKQVLAILESRGIDTNYVTINPNLAASERDSYEAKNKIDKINNTATILFNFFALDGGKQLEILPTLDREYRFDFPDGDLITDLALCVIANDYFVEISRVGFDLIDDLESRVGSAIGAIRAIIYDIDEEAEICQPESLLGGQWTFIRWLSRYLKACFQIDERSLTKKDLQAVINDRLHF